MDDITVAIDVSVDGFDKVKPWIPSLTVGDEDILAVDAIVKKELNIASTSSRRGRSLSVADRRRLETSIPHNAHQGLRMLRSNDLPNSPSCEIEDGGFACAKMSEIKLDLGKIEELIKPILSKVVNENDNGFFDEIGIPLQKLAQPLPGISDVSGKDITFLDIAEIFVPESKPGVDTARLVLKIYNALKTVSNAFGGSGGIVLAKKCVFRPSSGMSCTGGLTDFLNNDGRREIRRRAELSREMEENFVTYDRGGLPISPAHRFLPASCPEFDKEPCDGTCDCDGKKIAITKCEARKMRCKAQNSVKSLRFPFLDNPASLLGLLTGKDIEILEFYPPPLVFGFSYEFSTVIYTPPIVNLIIDFGVTVTIEYALVLDSKGIRQAIEEKNPAKALNSFAIRDTFDGVDKPLIVFEAQVGAAVEVSAAFVTIGVRGGITITVEIDVSRLDYIF